MFTLFKNKSKKSGPLKALSSVFTSDEKSADGRMGSAGDGHNSATTAAGGSKKNNAQSYTSKDDLSVLRQEGGKKKNSKSKANPYATTKMWRPITMTSSVSQNEEVFRSFTNFDVLVGEASPRLPATGDLRNEDVHAAPPALSRTISNPVTANEFQASVVGDTIPPDYNPHPSPDIPVRSVRHSGENSQVVKKRLEPRRSAPPAPFMGSSEASVKRTATRSSSSSSAVTIPLTPRSVSMEERAETVDASGPPPRRSRPLSRSATTTAASSDMNGWTNISADYPQDSSSSASSQRSRSLSQGSRGRGESSERRGRSVMDSSYDVVSTEVTKSVKAVLSKMYGADGFDAASQDVETMLVPLKGTMETLKTSQAEVTSSGSQFQTVRQELQLQTKQFVQDAKCLVAAANGPRPALSGHLVTAMHTLARILLHSQATMVRMTSVHQAQHMGFEVLKVSASFKSTVAAANAALGKPTADPHMKYLMRQATNLAGLLSTLLKTLKTLEQT